MKNASVLSRWIIRSAQILALTACLVASTSHAAEGYGVTNRLNGITLLAPPPIPDSPEYKADLDSARTVFKGRTPEQEAKALKYSKLTVFNFTPVIGDFFQPGNLPKTEAFFEKIKPEIRPSVLAPKDHWKRIRPYDVDKELWLGKPEESFSYPSGHSTVGMVQALLLSEIFPEKREELLQVGRDIGWARVVIGKHFPTDVRAGRVLAQAIVRELLNSPELRKDLDEVKAEVQTVQKMPVGQAVKPGAKKKKAVGAL